MTDTIKILKISDTKAGHVNTSNAIVKSLSNIYQEQGVEVETLELKFKVKFFSKLLKLSTKSTKLLNSVLGMDKFITTFYKTNKEELSFLKDYDFIVSSGGDTAFANIYLAKKYGLKNIYASRLESLSPELFYCITTIYEKDNYANSILLDFSPIDKGSVDQEKLHLFQKTISLNNETLFSLLIGGKGAGYHYSEKDMIGLINSFLAQLEKNDSYGLISTSRRTGTKFEELIKKTIEESKYKDRVKYLILFNEKPEYLLDCFLASSEVLFVTEESGAMMSEAILSNKAVYSLQPQKISYNKLYKEFLDSKGKYLNASIKIEDLEGLEVTKKINHEGLDSPSKIFERKLESFLEKN